VKESADVEQNENEAERKNGGKRSNGGGAGSEEVDPPSEDVTAHVIEMLAAAKELGLKVPLVVRLEGTNVELGRKILQESGLAIQAASTMADGAQKVVAAVEGRSK